MRSSRATLQRDVLPSDQGHSAPGSKAESAGGSTPTMLSVARPHARRDRSSANDLGRAMKAESDATPQAPGLDGAPEELDPALCYRILLTRDRRFDGRFFVAVVTTGVYCRPICPVSPPRPWNVRFYRCAAAAEAAGFRPCKRCRPETSPGTPAWMGSSAIVARALRLLAMPPMAGASPNGSLRSPSGAAAPAGPHTDARRIGDLADRLGVGERQLRRLFEAHLGAPPGAIARANRVHLARRLLDETDWKIADVALAAGFESLRQFNHAIRTTFGSAPRQIRKARTQPATGSPRGSASRPSAQRSRERGKGSVKLQARRSSLRRPGALADRDPSDGALSLRLPYRPPFDWPPLRDFLAARAIPGIESVDANAYRRTICLPEAHGILTLRPVAERCHVVLTLDLMTRHGDGDGAGPLGSIAHVVARARRILDLDADPARISADLARSAPLARAVARHPGLRVPGAWDPFELAVRAILGQQVTVRGATTLARRLVERFGTPIETGARLAARTLTHLFPSPACLRDADLAAIGLPRSRAETIRGFAATVDGGGLALGESASLDDLVARLVALPGIGDWTAHYVAMRAFGEPDAFPAADLGLRRALRQATGNSDLTTAEIAAAAEGWHPWRAYAVMHLWLAEQSESKEV